MGSQKVWDLPVRICHWALVFIIAFQYLSAEILDDSILPNTIQWHFYVGYSCIALVIFRVCWGLLGTYYAKFNQFIVSPSSALQYLRKGSSYPPHAGHNPAGGYATIMMLTLVLTQAMSGLFISDDIFSDGPYFGILSVGGQSVANFIHHNVYVVLFGFIGLHVLTVIYYKIRKKQNLTKAMITGNKMVADCDKRTITFPWLGLLLSIVITVAAMYMLLEVLPAPPVDDYYDY